MTTATFTIVAHCLYKDGAIHHWMHDLVDSLPLPVSFAATVMDNSGGRRIAQACMIVKSDMEATDPRVQASMREVVDHVEAVGEVLAKPDHSLILVTFKLHDPWAVLGEADCATVFARQFTEHTIMGRA